MRARTSAAIAAVLAIAVISAGSLAVAKPGGHHPDDHAGKQQQRLERRALFAVLSGTNELGTDGRRGAGDPDGAGSFTATVDDGQLCFGITVKNLDAPAAAHIHKGKRNENGPIVVPLTQPSGGDPGASSGCVTVDAALA